MADMTLEQIEAHLDQANLDQYTSKSAPLTRGGGGEAAPHSIGDVLKQVCGVYNGVKPILEAVVKFPLLPKKIKEGLKTFMDVMNTVCPA